MSQSLIPKTTNLEASLTNAIKTFGNNCNICVYGAPGIGKSQIIENLKNPKTGKPFKVQVVRAYETGEFTLGLPMVNSKVTTFTKPEWVDSVLTNKPDILLFDDHHLAPESVSNYLYMFLTDRVFQGVSLGNLIVIFAGNWGIKGATPNDIPAPVMSRMDYLVEFVPNYKDFCGWAYKANRISTEILDFIKIQGNNDYLYTADPAAGEMSINPRVWEKLSKALTAEFPLPETDIQNVIGPKLASLYLDYRAYFKNSLNDLLSKKFDSNSKIADVCYTAVVIASKVTDIDWKKVTPDHKVLKFILSLREEAQLLFFKKIVTRMVADKQDPSPVVTFLIKYAKGLANILEKDPY